MWTKSNYFGTFSLIFFALSYSQAPSFIQLLAKIHTQKNNNNVGLVMGGFMLIAISRQGSNTLLSALCFSITGGHAT